MCSNSAQSPILCLYLSRDISELFSAKTLTSPVHSLPQHLHLSGELCPLEERTVTRPAFISSLLLLILGFQSPAFAESARRYVVVGPDINRMEARAMRHRGKLQHRMNFYRGLVAELNQKDAENLRQELGREYLVEEDAEVKTLGRLHSLALRSYAQPAQSIPWGITAIRAKDAWSYNRGLGVKVCEIGRAHV